jgi:hypothetical protein
MTLINDYYMKMMAKVLMKMDTKYDFAELSSNELKELGELLFKQIKKDDLELPEITEEILNKLKFKINDIYINILKQIENNENICSNLMMIVTCPVEWKYFNDIIELNFNKIKILVSELITNKLLKDECKVILYNKIINYLKIANDNLQQIDINVIHNNQKIEIDKKIQELELGIDEEELQKEAEINEKGSRNK